MRDIAAAGPARRLCRITAHSGKSPPLVGTWFSATRVYGSRSAGHSAAFRAGPGADLAQVQVHRMRRICCPSQSRLSASSTTPAGVARWTGLWVESGCLASQAAERHQRQIAPQGRDVRRRDAQDRFGTNPEPPPPARLNHSGRRRPCAPQRLGFHLRYQYVLARLALQVVHQRTGNEMADDRGLVGLAYPARQSGGLVGLAYPERYSGCYDRITPAGRLPPIMDRPVVPEISEGGFCEQGGGGDAVITTAIALGIREANKAAALARGIREANKAAIIGHLVSGALVNYLQGETGEDILIPEVETEALWRARAAAAGVI